MAIRQGSRVKDAQAAAGIGLVDKVYAQLEEMIVTLELPPGAMLSEAELAGMLSVSRTPVGEALQRLAREGMVTILPKRGIVVTDVNVADQLRLLELRRELSRFLARVGARRATSDEREAMRQLVGRFMRAAQSNDHAELLRVDKQFHELFVGCAHNHFAAATLGSTDALARRFWYAHRTASVDPKLMAELHRNLGLAVAEGDESAAAQASDALADYLDRFTRETLNLPPSILPALALSRQPSAAPSRRPTAMHAKSSSARKRRGRS